jgi:hypothetical protein
MGDDNKGALALLVFILLLFLTTAPFLVIYISFGLPMAATAMLFITPLVFVYLAIIILISKERTRTEARADLTKEKDPSERIAYEVLKKEKSYHWESTFAVSRVNDRKKRLNEVSSKESRNKIIPATILLGLILTAVFAIPFLLPNLGNILPGSDNVSIDMNKTIEPEPEQDQEENKESFFSKLRKRASESQPQSEPREIKFSAKEFLSELIGKIKSAQPEPQPQPDQESMDVVGKVKGIAASIKDNLSNLWPWILIASGIMIVVSSALSFLYLRKRKKPSKPAKKVSVKKASKKVKEAKKVSKPLTPKININKKKILIITGIVLLIAIIAALGAAVFKFKNKFLSVGSTLKEKLPGRPEINLDIPDVSRVTDIFSIIINFLTTYRLFIAIGIVTLIIILTVLFFFDQKKEETK